MLPDFDQTTVDTVITQATPHRMPVAAIDQYLVKFYDDVNAYWIQNGSRQHENVVVVSTGGGFRDILVRDGLTILDEVNHLRFLSSSLGKRMLSMSAFQLLLSQKYRGRPLQRARARRRHR